MRRHAGHGGKTADSTEKVGNAQAYKFLAEAELEKAIFKDLAEGDSVAPIADSRTSL